MANCTALTASMAHITLNYGTRRAWTHIANEKELMEWGRAGGQKAVAVPGIARRLGDVCGTPLSEVRGYLMPSSEFNGISFVEVKTTQVRMGMVSTSRFLKPFMSFGSAQMRNCTEQIQNWVTNFTKITHMSSF